MGRHGSKRNSRTSLRLNTGLKHQSIGPEYVGARGIKAFYDAVRNSHTWPSLLFPTILANPMTTADHSTMPSMTWVRSVFNSQFGVFGQIPLPTRSSTSYGNACPMRMIIYL